MPQFTFIRKLLDLIPDAAFVVNMNDEIVYCNYKCEQFFNIELEDIIGRSDYMKNLVKKDTKSFIWHVINNKLEDLYTSDRYYDIKCDIDKNFYNTECSYIINDKTRYLWVKCSILYGDNNNPIGGLEFIRDITSHMTVKKQLAEGYIQLKNALAETVVSLSSTVQFSDPYTYKHQLEVARLCKLVCLEMKLESSESLGIITAAKLHDIGKLAIPKELLSKPTKLPDIEFELIKTHSNVGYEILNNIPFGGEPVSDIILQHHERLDGSGYPYGLRGEEILNQSKILMVCDVIEALSSHRPYRPAISEGRLKTIVLNEVKNGRLDKDIVELTLDVFYNKFDPIKHFD